MPYLLTTDLTFQAIELNKTLEVISKAKTINKEVDLASSTQVKVAAGQTLTVSLAGLTTLVSILVVSDQPVDVALTTDVAVLPVFTGVKSNVFFRVFNTGTAYETLAIQGAATDAIVRIATAGDLTPL